MNETMNIKLLKDGWNYYCTDYAACIKVKDILDHISKGGNIKVLNKDGDDVTGQVLLRVFKHINLKTDAIYQAIRSSHEVH
jgi:hypothetical protein